MRCFLAAIATAVLLAGTAQAQQVSSYQPPFTPLANSISGAVALNNTGTYFDGPIVAQGTAGTWFASGTVTVIDSVGAANILCKLWDNTTTAAGANTTTTAAGAPITVSMSGFFTAPAASIRISCKDTTSTNGSMLFNQTGTSTDGTLTLTRIK